MGEAISKQHPAVVLRSHYNHVRVLLAIAMIAVVGLAVAVVLVARDDGGTGTVVSAPATAAPASPGNIRYDGGPEEGSADLASPVVSGPGVRYDGGPEEGSASIRP
jgi:hypothetical protein